GHVDNSSYPTITVDIQLTLTTPEKATGPVPVMMEFGFLGFGGGFGGGGFGRGPATRPGLAGAQTRPTTRPAFAGGGFGGAPRGPTWQQQVVSKGWGYAIISPNSIQADNGAGL